MNSEKLREKINEIDIHYGGIKDLQAAIKTNKGYRGSRELQMSLILETLFEILEKLESVILENEKHAPQDIAMKTSNPLRIEK